MTEQEFNEIKREIDEDRSFPFDIPADADKLIVPTKRLFEIIDKYKMQIVNIISKHIGENVLDKILDRIDIWNIGIDADIENLENSGTNYEEGYADGLRDTKDRLAIIADLIQEYKKGKEPKKDE